MIVCPWHPGAMWARPVASLVVWARLDEHVHMMWGGTMCGFPRGETPLKMSKKGYRPLVRYPKALEEDPRRGGKPSSYRLSWVKLP